jgi:hypothetical protein
MIDHAVTLTGRILAGDARLAARTRSAGGREGG